MSDRRTTRIETCGQRRGVFSIPCVSIDVRPSQARPGLFGD